MAAIFSPSPKMYVVETGSWNVHLLSLLKHALVNGRGVHLIELMRAGGGVGAYKLRSTVVLTCVRVCSCMLLAS